jgi:hypothetical protein
MGSIDAMWQVDTSFVYEDGDHERYAHYVEKSESMRGYVEGVPVVALCGKVWVPHKDPKKFPICPSCKDILDALFLPHD